MHKDGFCLYKECKVNSRPLFLPQLTEKQVRLAENAVVRV